jgi:hypothetical protein
MHSKKPVSSLLGYDVILEGQHVAAAFESRHRLQIVTIVLARGV